MLRGVAKREIVTPLTVGMSSQRWLEIPTELVRISDLWVTQPGVYFDALIKPTFPVGGDEYAHVVLHLGEAYVEDGHHRLVRALLRGEYLLEARVLLVAA